MNITLIAGDHDWTIEGTHVLDENGFAIVLSEAKEIEVTEETYARIMPMIEASREFRGLNHEGSVKE